MSINENEDEVIDDGLTQQQRELDAKMVAADFDPPYATMAAKKKVYRKKVDRRFKVGALDAAPTNTNDDEPWNSKTPVFEEVVRISQLVHTYYIQGAVVDTFRPDINKQEMIEKVFDGRPLSTNNLKKLYDFMQTRYSHGGRCLVTCPLYWLVQQILVNEKAITQLPPEKLSAVFDDIFAGIASVTGEAK